MTRYAYWGGLRLGGALLLGICGLDRLMIADDVPPRNFSVQISAQVSESPPRIVLSWPDEGDARSYRIYRRSTGLNWEQIATLDKTKTSFSDSNVTVGAKYEYQMIKPTSGRYTGYGYISSGIKVPVPDARGTLVLLIENSIASALNAELRRLESDLIGDGWMVIRRNVSQSDSPATIKGMIKGFHEADPAGVQALFLLGHVPVPYSGNFYPDGHENHQGAWPADSYYADMDGKWTDSSVDNTKAEREANWNVPGDGKFDQSRIPSEVEFMVGRVDLSNLTSYANKPNARSEIDLTKQYLDKNHAFRFGEIVVEKRGLICDNFSDKGADPISNSAWRNFAPLLGPDSITEVGWNGYLPAASGESYLWSYASGGGTYYYSVGVATADDFALQDVKVVFTMFMGSYFGDWNNESNFLRAALGSGYVLSSTYSGFPHTLYFPMGLGEPIGECIRLTMNNAPGTLYPPWNKGAGQVHIALHGDPTLRLSAVRPPSALMATVSSNVTLSWSPTSDSAAGYHIYRATASNAPYIRLTTSPVTQTSFTDSPASGSYTYMVRALKLEESGSGTYLNLSQGIFVSATVGGRPGGITPLQLELGSGVLRVMGESGQKFRIYSSPDLTRWTEIGTGELAAGSVEVPIYIGDDRQMYYRTQTIGD
jgi:hypothetical protein